MLETLQAILWGGLACAIFDGLAASTQFALLGIPLLRVWQGVASGLLGERAFAQGWLSGSLGLLLHFVIAFLWAAAFAELCRVLPLIARIYWLSGPLYGGIVFLVMNLLVVPLSARPKRSASPPTMAVQLIIHILFVGLPIALAANRFIHFIE
jgi:hypothetical protein